MATAIISVCCWGIWQKCKQKRQALEGWNGWISWSSKACFQFSIESGFASIFILLAQTYPHFDSSLKALTTLIKPITALCFTSAKKGWNSGNLHKFHIKFVLALAVRDNSGNGSKSHRKRFFTWIIKTIKDHCKYSLELFLLQKQTC